MTTESDGTNPLLEGFVPFIPISRMPAALLYEPLSKIPWRSVPPEMREQYLELHEEHFFPTGYSVDIALRVQAAILASLDRRNPLSRSEQKRIVQLSLINPGEPEALRSLSSPAAAGILMASTGMGKTSIAKRILKVIAPEQVMQHSRSEQCGWSKLIQIAYLHLDFPSNGTRAGLIDQILNAIDALIGTDYVGRVRRMNLETGLIEVMKQLSNHRVGMLVIDEIQEDMFNNSPFQRQFVFFLLLLVNLGIPLLLCGQPSGFAQLIAESQTLRRFSKTGLFELHRAASDDDRWWSSELATGIMRFNLCEETRDADNIVAQSRSVSAGVPGYFAQLWVETQRIALRRGGDVASIMPDDVEIASRSHAIAKVMQDARELEAQTKWIAKDSLGKDAGTTNLRAADQQKDVVEKAVRSARAAEKRKKKQAEAKRAREKEYLKNLAGDDLRIANRALDLLDGLDSIQGDLLEENPASVVQGGIV